MLAAKNDALTVQVHSGTGISQVGERNLHLDQRTDRGHYIRLDVDPESVDVTRNASPAMRLPIRGRPHEERRGTHWVTFRFSQFYGSVHVLVAFTESAPGLR